MKALILTSLLLSSVLALPAARLERVPSAALAYKARVIREARAAGGLAAPVSMFAAQLHQESGWRTDARSGVGAIGLAQFMPGTSAWIANLYSADLKPGAPLDPGWAIRALVRYDYWMNKRLQRYEAGDERWAATLAGYNGGLGWVLKDARLSGCTRWFRCAENVQDGRTAASLKENRGYPERILHVLRPLYINWN